MLYEKLHRLTVKELLFLAQKHGATIHQKMKKADLISAIRAVCSKKWTSSQKVAPPPPVTCHDGSSTQPSLSGPSFVGPLGEPGLPIPNKYGKDCLVLLVQDPQHVFAYWEISSDTLSQVRQSIGHDGTPVLVIHSVSGSEQREIDLSGGNYYLAVSPNAGYQAEIALRTIDGRLVSLVRSNSVHMPRSKPSDNIDEEWMVTEDTFTELLLMAHEPGTAGSSATVSAEQLVKARAYLDSTLSLPSGNQIGSSSNLQKQPKK